MDSDIHGGSADSNEATVDVERTVEIANILRNERRIQVIIELKSAGEGGLSVGVLADRIAENEDGPDFTSVRKRVYISLYQTHIPTLDTVGVVDSGRDRDYVTRTSRFDEVISALHRLQE